jgi:predicted nucleic acid-binding protein
MNVVDSSGWLEYFSKGENAEFFSASIQDTENLLVPTISIYEVFKRMLNQLGEDSALQSVGIMSLGVTVNLTQEIAINAAKISNDLNIAMADSVILATARAHDATLWTQDVDFQGIEGVEYLRKN